MIPLLLPSSLLLLLACSQETKTFSSLHGCVLIYDGRRGKRYNDDDEERNWHEGGVCAEALWWHKTEWTKKKIKKRIKKKLYYMMAHCIWIMKKEKIGMKPSFCISEQTWLIFFNLSFYILRFHVNFPPCYPFLWYFTKLTIPFVLEDIQAKNRLLRVLMDEIGRWDNWINFNIVTFSGV